MRSLPSVLKEVKAGLRSSRCKRGGLGSAEPGAV